MKFRKMRSTTGQTKVEIQMTPMLDMIFQLLIFFILTFKPIIDEGQFGVNMSGLPGGSVLAATQVPGVDPEDSATPPPEVQFNPPYQIKLVAGPDGSLAPGGIIMGDRAVPDMNYLHAELKRTVGNFADDFEVVIVADTNLHYEHVVQAVNAISHAGVKKINFGTPAPAQPGSG